MNRTPLLRPLRDNGATLYVFPSASEDIGLNLNSRATGVAMSHYALLNLPNLCDETSQTGESTKIATELQNYVMNFETLLLNQSSYNYQDYHTVSERVFWHWLFSKNKIDISYNPEQSKTYFTEEPSMNKVIQCFGSIDAGNSLSTEFGMFNETYVNIPTSYANGPVFLHTVQDSSESNYILGKKYTYSDKTNLQGRDSNVSKMKLLEDVSPMGDGDGFYEASDAYEIVKDITQVQAALREYTKNDGIIINSYDDVNIDSKEQFKGTDFDITSEPVEFGFNAILLYYSVYDQDDTTKSAYATNLFGIIFLDSPNTVGTDGKYTVEQLIKKKSYGGNSGSNFFGNSYSFRVNIKTMSVYDNTDAVIQDNTTMTSIMSVDYSDVVSNLNRAIDVMNTNVQTTMAIQDNYMNILRYYDEQRTNIDDISTRLNGFINGTKSSTVNAHILKTDEIQPATDDDNFIKLKFNRRAIDYIDNEVERGTQYIPPIIAVNDNETFNIPTVYKPLIEHNPNSEGTFVNYIGNVNSIIDNIKINYYVQDGGKVHQNMIMPTSVLRGYGLDNIVRLGSSIDAKDASIANVTFINYDALIPLLITYIKDLRSEINDIKANGYSPSGGGGSIYGSVNVKNETAIDEKIVTDRKTDDSVNVSLSTDKGDVLILDTDETKTVQFQTRYDIATGETMYNKQNKITINLDTPNE